MTSKLDPKPIVDGTDYATRIVEAPNTCIPWPKTWPPYRNGGSTVCDMIQGPCACGATHRLTEWAVQPTEANYCDHCGYLMEWHDGSWSGWVHSNDNTLNAALSMECRAIRKFDPAYRTLLLDALRWRREQPWTSKADPELIYDFCAALVFRAVFPEINN